MLFSRFFDTILIMEEKSISIEKITLAENGMLFVKPKDFSFDKIYRSAMGVHWDSKNFCLHPNHPIDKEWRAIQWFGQIVAAVKNEYGIILKTDNNTVYENVDIKAEDYLYFEVAIIKITDYDNQPGWVECRFKDAYDYEHTIEEKIPVVSKTDINLTTLFPQQGMVACIFVKQFVDKNGKKIITVSTENPWSIGTINGISEFDMFEQQVKSGNWWK